MTLMSDRPVLSVLDLVPVGVGSTHGEALRAALALVAHCDRLGYHRYWVAEHHNMPGIASSSPAVLLAHLAMCTSTIRLGSGGVMLPNHSPLVVAEQFGMLEALHPGRIDLGIGRAPGTDPFTAAALRRTFQADGPEVFSRNLAELIDYFDDDPPADPTSPRPVIRATPGRGDRPQLWLLGSSDFSAHLAGQLGLPFSFAHHFSGNNTDAAVAVYRRSFRPSAVLEQPYVMLGVNALCAPTAAEAGYLARPAALAMARLRQGHPDRYPTPEQAAAHEFTPIEAEVANGWTRHHLIGEPPVVVDGLVDLARRTGADELMITTVAHDPEHRMRSYRLIADAWGMTG